MTNQKPLPNPLLVPRIIWGALIFCSLMYQTILKTQPPPEEASTALLLPLSILAAAVFVMSFVLPTVLARSARRTLSSDIDFRRAVQAFTVPFILRMALSDSICLMGLVVGFQAGIRYYYMFWAAGVVAMLLAFPTESGIRKLIPFK